MELISERVDEADARCVDIEHADGLAAAGPEAVLDVRRYREERPGADAVPVAVLEELDLALEDVERVGVVGGGVRVDALEPRLEGELDHLEVRQLAQDRAAAKAAIEPLALARADEVRLVHRHRSWRTSSCTRTAPTPFSTA